MATVRHRLVWSSIVLVLGGVASVSAQSPPDVDVYQRRCGTCHGSAVTGGSGPAILAYVRYHTDAEVTAAIRERHRTGSPIAVTDGELPQILAGIRELAGTNPAMATGGFTGQRPGGAASPLPQVSMSAG